MQKIKVTKVEPVNENCTAVFQGKARFSGFQPELKTVQPGDVIEVEIEVSDKGYNNIKKVAGIEHGTGSPTPTTNGRSKSDCTQESIEAQVAFKGIMQLAAAGVQYGVSNMPGGFQEVYDKAIAWADARLGGNPEPKPSPRPIDTPVAPKEKPLIQLDWLKDSLETLQKRGLGGWSNSEVISRLNKVTGASAKKVSEAVMKLTPLQAGQFVKEIQSALDDKK